MDRCLTCSNASSCLTCNPAVNGRWKSGRPYMYKGQCYDSCASIQNTSTFLNGTTCQGNYLPCFRWFSRVLDCDSSCLTCKGTAKTCTSCKPPLLLDGNQCNMDCTGGRYKVTSLLNSRCDCNSQVNLLKLRFIRT